MFKNINLEVKCCLPLKDAGETMWSNDESDSVIVLIVTVVSLIIDDHVVQDNTSTHNQPKSALRVRTIRDG
jgi:hypothetical protein